MSTELSEVARVSARGSFFLFLGNTSSTIIMAVASIIVARLLGPEDYGLYTIAFIAPSLLVALSDLGISSALTRFSAHFRSEGKNRKALALVKAGIIFKAVFSLLFSLVLLLFSESIATGVFRRPNICFLIRLTSLYLFGQALFGTLNSVFIGLDKTENSCLLMNTQAISKAVASPLLVILGMGVIGAILGAGLGFLVATLTGVTLLLLRVYPSLHSHDDDENLDFFQGLKLIISYGIPLYISDLIFNLLKQYGSFVLALFVSNVEIGNYITAMNFSVLIAILSYPIMSSLFPAFSKISIKEDRNTVEKMFKLSVKYTSLLVIPASFAVAVLSNEIIYVLYGSQYGLAPGYLAVYMLYFLCVGLGMFVLSTFFNGQGDTVSTFRMNLIKLGLSVPLAFVLTFYYGVLGLVASLLASQLLSTTYGLFLARKKYATTVDWASSLRIGFASISSALLVYIIIVFAPISVPLFKLVIGGSLYVAFFLAFAPLLRAIDKVDTENLDKMLKELPLIYPIARRILKLEEKILALNVNF